MINFNARNVNILSFIVTSILFFFINLLLVKFNIVRKDKIPENQSVYVQNQNLNQIEIENQIPKNQKEENSKNKTNKNSENKSQTNKNQTSKNPKNENQTNKK